MPTGLCAETKAMSQFFAANSRPRAERGRVTLSGRVKTKQDEQKAIELARKIRGVADVKSTLQIEQQAPQP